MRKGPYGPFRELDGGWGFEHFIMLFISMLYQVGDIFLEREQILNLSHTKETSSSFYYKFSDRFM